MQEPSYLQLYRSGALKSRLDVLEKELTHCTICPRRCGVDRTSDSLGFCQAGFRPHIDSICAHHGEEPVISRQNGSGTVFFGGCNLRCVYCQNHQISQDPRGFLSPRYDFHTAAREIVRLQDDAGIHNINFVSPSHFVPQMIRIIYEAIALGLHLPIVYNSNAYDSLDTLKLLDGIIDIYLPDFKYFDAETGIEYSEVQQYPTFARTAIKEMYRQVGALQTNSGDLGVRGLLIRHLVLPNHLANSEAVFSWIADELGTDVPVSLMSQYFPTHKALSIPLLARKISYNEYQRVQQWLKKFGLVNGYIQGMSAPEFYQPDFNRKGHPFELS